MSSRRRAPGWLVAVAAGLFSLLLLPFSVAPAAAATTATAVAFSDDAAWTATIRGFDPATVQSVVYYVRDAGKRWHATVPVESAPFAIQLPWWTWSTAGKVAVTSHVQLRDGRVVKDPGGWTQVDGRRVNPSGQLESLVNTDDSLDVRYTPDRGGDVVQAVQFWLRVNGHWRDAGEVANRAADGAFEIISVPDTASGTWKSDDTAVSVHVVWPGGLQTVDPAPWVWRDHFGRATVVPQLPELAQTPTPAAPTPTPTSTPVPATPTPAPPPPPPAAPPPAPAPPPVAPAPPPPAPAGCYPHTNSGGCYQPGEFCRTSDHGATGRTASGEAIVCRDNNGWRWEPA